MQEEKRRRGGGGTDVSSLQFGGVLGVNSGTLNLVTHTYTWKYVVKG